MSKLDELIKKLCPNGVEYKELKDLCIISRGKVISKDYIRDNPGNFPVYSSQTENEGNLGNISTYDYDGEYLTWTTDGANAGTVFYRNTKFNVTNVCGLLKIKVEKITSKFLYYFLVVKAPEYVNRGMGNPKLMSNVMERIKVPLPPLEVQNEIVKVLDNYTKSIKELKEKINKELVARKKQYSWYRDYLLKFENKIKIVKLGDIVKVYDGTHQTPNYKTDGIPFISVENINNIYNTEKYISEEDYEKNYKIKPKIDDIFMTRIGTIGKCAIVTEDIPLAYYVSLALLRPDKNKIDSGYLKYIIESEIGRKELNKRILFTAVPIKINKGDIDKIEIPLPPLEVQKRIVEVLDNFEKICNDLNIGLPTEIEARQKQYEFYRNYLLTFDNEKIYALSKQASKQASKSKI